MNHVYIYYKKIFCIIAIYIDDILIVGNNEKYKHILIEEKKKIINKVKLVIYKNFELSDIGNIDFIIGIKFIKCKDGCILHQLICT